MLRLMGEQPTRSEEGAPGDEGLRYDSAPVRRRRILSAVGDAGFVSVTELTARLGVSDMTVRRDLRKLAHQGKVRIVHGGVSALTGTAHSAAFTGRAEEHAAAKRLIGEAVARDLPQRGTIAVDAGTSTYAAVQALPDTFRGTVVTHSIPVMQLLLNRGLGGVVGLGGELLPESQAFVGPRTVEAVHGLRVQTLLLGAAAVDERGIYVATDNERPTKLALMAIADRVVLLIDASKFGASAPVHLCGWDRISSVVTDAPPPSAVLAGIPRLASILEVAGPRASPGD
jgi:DeoR family transcriptional regulator, fructose operon transcriptional repressor